MPTFPLEAIRMVSVEPASLKKDKAVEALATPMDALVMLLVSKARPVDETPTPSINALLLVATTLRGLEGFVYWPCF